MSFILPSSNLTGGGSRKQICQSFLVNRDSKVKCRLMFQNLQRSLLLIIFWEWNLILQLLIRLLFYF